MKRARRFPRRLIHLTSLCVCFALILSVLAVFPFQVGTGKNGKVNSTGQSEQGSSPNGKGRRVAAPQPQPGPPAANLPNLDDVRRRKPEPPQALPHIPSTLRSRRNPLKPWDGIRVGDPLPSKKHAAVETIRSGSRQPSTAESDRTAVMTVTNESAHNDREGERL